MARIRSFAILTHFSEISDPRIDRTKYHNLQDMIVVAICAAICGANGWADVERFGKAKIEWLRQFVPLKNGVPSHDTFGRVFAMLDTAEFYTCMHNWLRNFRLSLKGQHVAIDGKTLRGSHDRSKGFSALHMVSAWASGLRLNLGQNSVDDKSNEIPAVTELLQLLQLKGAIVTLDAMHCQADTAEQIRKGGGRLHLDGERQSTHASRNTDEPVHAIRGGELQSAGTSLLSNYRDQSRTL